ncbi:MAG: PAS-domain containing protein [Holosporaceae bacterium]|jgi:signal transduction histidine kinase|nr:PAS-domain containing protein [Holosporaceae bacterium]
MKAWSKTDLIGLLLVIFGIVSFLFSNSVWLASISALLASLSLLLSVYDARYSVSKYRNLLCHYQAVLSSSENSWVAWNGNDEYIGASKKLRILLGIKQNTFIHMGDILSSLDSDDAGELSLNFNRLKKQGMNFTLLAKTRADGKFLRIHGSRMIINGLDTSLLWCSDATESINLTDSMEQRLAAVTRRLDSMMEILDALPIPIWRRGKNLKIVYCNKTYADYLNSNTEKIIMQNTPLIPGSLFGHGHSLAENAQKTHREQSIAQSISIGGERKMIRIHECPADEENFIGYATDATEEENLASNLDRIVTANCEVLENLPTAIVVFGENTRVAFFNSAYQKLMNLESGWLRSKPTYGEVLDELRNNRLLAEQADYQAFRKTQLTLFSSITSATRELVHLPNGKTLRLLIAPYPLGGLLFMYEDVSDSLALQRQNNTLLAVHKETINNLQEGIMVYGSDNRLKIINDSMLKMWRLDKLAVDLKGKHLSELLDHVKNELDHGPDWKEFLENAISNLTDRITKTGTLTKKDGTSLLFSYIPLPDGAHMHSFTDITDTCMVEQAIMEKDQALKAAQKLRSEFVSGISIELKEPLNILIGFTELLFYQYFGSLNAKQLEYCQHVLGASHQLCKLVTDLQEMVSIDMDSSTLDLSLFSINVAVDEVIHSLEKRICEKSINMEKNYPTEEEVRFNGDRTRFKQAVYNILSNAIHRTLPNGRVDVVVIVNEDELKIIIKDDGIGFSVDEGKKIFKRSRAAYSHGESDGISMPFARSLIELHGGKMSITSDIREGTCVVCSFPISQKIQQNEKEETEQQKQPVTALQEAVNL